MTMRIYLLFFKKKCIRYIKLKRMLMRKREIIILKKFFIYLTDS